MTRTIFKLVTFSFLIWMTGCHSANKEQWHFAQLADPQIGMGGYEHDKLTFQACTEEINEHNPSFTIICGDLVESGSVDSFTEFQQIASQLTSPYYCVPGNHDVVWKADNLFALYEEMIGPQYYYKDLNGWRFVFVNTNRWKDKRYKDKNDEYEQWFEGTLKDANDKQLPIIVAGHHPFFLENPDEEEKYFNLPTEKRLKLIRLLKKYEVKAYLSGHLHQDLVLQHEGILYIGCASTSRNFDDTPYGYRLWTVDKDLQLTPQYIPLKEQPAPIPIEKVGKEK